MPDPIFASQICATANGIADSKSPHKGPIKQRTTHCDISLVRNGASVCMTFMKHIIKPSRRLYIPTTNGSRIVKPRSDAEVFALARFVARTTNHTATSVDAVNRRRYLGPSMFAAKCQYEICFASRSISSMSHLLGKAGSRRFPRCSRQETVPVDSSRPSTINALRFYHENAALRFSADWADFILDHFFRWASWA
jgi:hypothetical protein